MDDLDKYPKSGSRPERTAKLPADSSSVPRVKSSELLGEGRELIIEHARREYHLRVTHSGKLILTA